MDQLTTGFSGIAIDIDELSEADGEVNIGAMTYIDPEVETEGVTLAHIHTIIREFFRILEQESYSQGFIDFHTEKWRQLPIGTTILLHKLVVRESHGVDTELRLRDILTGLGLCNTTNFRSADTYYITMLGDFLKNIDFYDLI